jgi:hypothetical protein
MKGALIDSLFLIDPYQSLNAVDTLGLRWINTALSEQ